MNRHYEKEIKDLTLLYDARAKLTTAKDIEIATALENAIPPGRKKRSRSH